MGRRLLRTNRARAEHEGDEKELQGALQIDARGQKRTPIQGLPRQRGPIFCVP
jgi:hypothetical protein